MPRLTTLFCTLAIALGHVTTADARGDAAAGKEKSAPCQACHGPDGNSPLPTYPKLAGQHADYIVRVLTDYQTGARKNPIMAPMAKPLSAQDREDLAAYFSSQQEGLHTIDFKD